MATPMNRERIPGPPLNRSVWTWIWLAFAVLTLVLTVIGFIYAGSVRWD